MMHFVPFLSINLRFRYREIMEILVFCFQKEHFSLFNFKVKNVTFKALSEQMDNL